MARVLMISANVTQDPYPVYPLGMSMVAHDLRSRGHDVIEWDMLCDGELDCGLDAMLGGRPPDVIGVSMRNIDSCNYGDSTSYVGYYRRLVERLRAMFAIPIVLGGPGYSLFPERLMKEVRADYGIVGEGEGVFARLAGDLASGRLPEVRIAKAAMPLDGAMIAAPGRNARHVDYYMRRGGMINVQTKRGCPLRCAYCSYPALEGVGYRYRSASDVADEIQALIERHGVDYYFMADSVYNDWTGRYLEITEEIVRRKIEVPWMAYFKPARFREEEVRLLKRSGLKAVEWGTDASTDRTLAGMRKHFTWAEVEEASRMFSSSCINCAHFIIFGGPQESEETVAEGLANIDRLKGVVVFASIGIRVMPGTAVHEHAIREGAIARDRDLLEPFYYFSPRVTPAFLDRAIRESFGARIDRVYPFERDMDRARLFRELGRRGPLWGMLLENRRSRLKRATQ